MNTHRKYYLLQLSMIGVLLLTMSGLRVEQILFDNLWIVVVTTSLYFIVLNYLFLNEIYHFVINSHNNGEVFHELLYVFLTGISNVLIFSTFYYYFGIMSDNSIIIKDFSSSLYFSIVTWTTLGYGDLHPLTHLRLISSAEALIGYMYMALPIGLFMSLIKINTQNK